MAWVLSSALLLCPGERKTHHDASKAISTLFEFHTSLSHFCRSEEVEVIPFCSPPDCGRKGPPQTDSKPELRARAWWCVSFAKFLVWCVQRNFKVGFPCVHRLVHLLSNSSLPGQGDGNGSDNWTTAHWWDNKGMHGMSCTGWKGVGRWTQAGNVIPCGFAMRSSNRLDSHQRVRRPVPYTGPPLFATRHSHRRTLLWSVFHPRAKGPKASLSSPSGSLFSGELFLTNEGAFRHTFIGRSSSFPMVRVRDRAIREQFLCTRVLLYASGWRNPELPLSMSGERIHLVPKKRTPGLGGEIGD